MVVVRVPPLAVFRVYLPCCGGFAALTFTLFGLSLKRERHYAVLCSGRIRLLFEHFLWFREP
jgi:hypothetical protein